MLIEIDLWTSYAANTCLDGETHAGRRSALRAVAGSFGITERCGRRVGFEVARKHLRGSS